MLTWNLMHGRSVPGAHRDLLEDFAGALSGWEWDVALLQEVPPWWPDALSRRLGAEYRLALTSRNALAPLRRAIARRLPDVIKSNGGGSNAILCRHDRIAAHRSQVLCHRPERRVAHGVQLGYGLWLVNLHATAHDAAAAERDGRLAASVAADWAGAGPVVLGGDFNLRQPAFDGFRHAGGRDVDHVFLRGAVEPASAVQFPDRGRLSDHDPVAVDVALIDR